MELRQSLDDWERRGARLRRILVYSVITYVTLAFLLVFVVNPIPPGDTYREVLGVGGAITSGLALIVGVYSAFAYFFKYSSAVRRLRYDIQVMLITDLQQQVAALREEMHKRT